MYFNRFLF